MLAAIEALAEVSVARGCGFAALAILTFMVGLSWDMALACEVGGLLMLLVCLVLIVKAQHALRRPVSRTELWMMLDRRHRPSEAAAQRIIGEALRTCYFRFAVFTAGLSAVLLAASLAIASFRPGVADPLCPSCASSVRNLGCPLAPGAGALGFERQSNRALGNTHSRPRACGGLDLADQG